MSASTRTESFLRRRALLPAIALVALLAGSPGAGAAEGLWEALADGGKVVMVRHTESAEAEPEVSLHLSETGDCSAEQELSDAGREQADSLRKALQARSIPVGEVLSSEFCRARQTAEGVFGEYEPWDALNLLPAMPPGESTWLMEDVRDRIGGFDGEDNLFLVTHRPNINTLTFENVEPGTLVILNPEGIGSFGVEGVITLEDYH